MNNLVIYTFPTANGCLLSTQNFANGNMLYATAQLLFLSNSPAEIYAAYFRGILDCDVGHPGAFSRYPGTTTDTSVDDYLAISCNRLLAVDVYNSSHFGFLSVNPGFTAAQFLYRFQGFWNHLKISAGVTVGPIGRFAWALSVLLAARQSFSNQDSWIQTHLMILTAKRRNYSSFIGELAVKYWFKKKGSMTTSQIFANYCGIPDHPLVEAWKPYK